jgi:GDP-mannose 4,6-dehydratase
MTKIRTALITGITGMVGSHLTDFLMRETNWQIVGMTRWRSPLRNIEHLLDEVNQGGRISLIEGDLLDQGSLLRVLDTVEPDVIFHLAAQSYPTASFNSPIVTLDTNILGTLRLLESIRILGQDPIIHCCSSSEVFGRVPANLVPIREETPFHPASPYSISKIGTDNLARFYFEAYEMRILTTRMFTHTGPRRGDVFAESSFAKQIALAEAGKAPKLIKVGNLNSLRTWADVRDAVEAYFLLVTRNPQFGEAYNIGGIHTATVGEMLNKLLDLSSCRDFDIVESKTRIRPLDADLQVPDCSKFKEHTGWQPKISFEQTMRDLLDYWREEVQESNAFYDR